MKCVEVCPVDAFYEGANMLVINPRECVDCGCCIDACPVDAIVFDDEPRAKPWTELNAKYAAVWPNVTFDDGQTPPDSADYCLVSDKFERYFTPGPGKGDVRTIAAGDEKVCGCRARKAEFGRRVTRSILIIACAMLVIGLMNWLWRG